MTYGLISNVPAPIEMYDAVHAEVIKQAGPEFEGLLVHVGRPTRDGFQVLEVWASKQECERFYEEVVDPIVARLSQGQAPPMREQISEEFDVRGLIVPGGGITV